MPGHAGAARHDEPWPGPPSCSHQTGTCAPLEDLVAYNCYFELEESPFPFCDDPFELLTEDVSRLVIPQPIPDPTPVLRY